MKNSEIALVIVIATVSVVASYFIGNMFLGDPNERVEEISYMAEISNELVEPDVETFNPYALNPTVEVYIGDCSVSEQWNPEKKICEPINDSSSNPDQSVVPGEDTSGNGANSDEGSEDSGSDNSNIVPDNGE